MTEVMFLLVTFGEMTVFAMASRSSMTIILIGGMSMIFAPANGLTGATGASSVAAAEGVVSAAEGVSEGSCVAGAGSATVDVDSVGFTSGSTGAGCVGVGSVGRGSVGVG